jgi:hypothetical protein
MQPRQTFWWIAAAVFGCMVAVNYLPVFSGKVPFPRSLVLRHAAWNGLPVQSSEPAPEIGDLITSFYPFHALASLTVPESAIPLWNPYILGGAPFEANSQSALFYPFNCLYYILPLESAWSVCLLLRMFLAATFMALFMRRVGASQGGAIFAGVTFASCGFITAWQGQAMGDAAIWLPLICYSVHRLHEDWSYKSIALGGLAFAMPVLAGHPETALHVTVTGSALALCLWIWPHSLNRRAFSWRFITVFAAAGLLALGIASIQLLPSLEWITQMGTPFDAPWPALSRHDGQGFFSRDLASSPNSAGLPIPEAAAYIGMFSLIVAPFALFHKSRPYVFFFIGTAVVAAAIAYGIEPLRWIITHTPKIKALKNGRLVLVVSFAIAAMAGLGISVLEDPIAFLQRRRRAMAFALFFVAAVAGGFSIYELHLATLRPVALTRGPLGSLIFLALGVLAITWRLSGYSNRRAFSIAACTLVGIELVSCTYGYTGFARPEEIFPAAPVFDFLQSQGHHGTFRVAKAGYPIPANSGIVYGLEMADGYEVCTAATKAFTADLTENRDDAVFFLADKVVQAQDRRVDMLNVRHFVVIKPGPEFDNFAQHPERFVEVFSEGSISVFENSSVLPRLIAVPQTGIRIIRDPAQQLEMVKDATFDPENMVLIGERPKDLASSDLFRGSSSSEIVFVSSSNNEFRFKARTSEPSVLVLSQMYYPGWKATVDGNPAPVYRVNYALSGILAPQGNHEIRFFFAPASFQIGAVVSAVSVLLVIGLLILGINFKVGLRRKREATPATT